MSSGAIKLLIFLAYIGFTLVSKAMKASRENRGIGGERIPQSAPRMPHPGAGPVPVRPRPTKALIRRIPARVVPIRKAPPVLVQRPKAAPQRSKDPEGPGHDTAHPVEAHPKPVEARMAALKPDTAASSLAALLTGRDDLRKGFLMAEVLGPPLALR